MAGEGIADAVLAYLCLTFQLGGDHRPTTRLWLTFEEGRGLFGLAVALLKMFILVPLVMLTFISSDSMGGEISFTPVFEQSSWNVQSLQPGRAVEHFEILADALEDLVDDALIIFE